MTVQFKGCHLGVLTNMSQYLAFQSVIYSNDSDSVIAHSRWSFFLITLIVDFVWAPQGLNATSVVFNGNFNRQKLAIQKMLVKSGSKRVDDCGDGGGDGDNGGDDGDDDDDDAVRVKSGSGGEFDWCPPSVFIFILCNSLYS